MGIELTKEDARQGVSNDDKREMFPLFRATGQEDEINVSPRDGGCQELYEAIYNCDFAISASDASTLTELIALAQGLVSLSTGNLATIINGVDAANAAINEAVDTEQQSAAQEFHLNPTPCHPPPDAAPPFQCFKITLQVYLTWLITDADPSDPDEHAEITLTLSALGQRAVKTFSHKKATSRPQSQAFEVSIAVTAHGDSQFHVYAKLDEVVSTDGPGFIGEDSVSLIRIDLVKIVFQQVPCLEESKVGNGEEESNTGGGVKGKSQAE